MGTTQKGAMKAKGFMAGLMGLLAKAMTLGSGGIFNKKSFKTGTRMRKNRAHGKRNQPCGNKLAKLIKYGKLGVMNPPGRSYMNVSQRVRDDKRERILAAR